MQRQRRHAEYVLLGAFLAIAPAAWAQDPALAAPQIREFLRTADVIAAEQSSIGVTHHLVLAPLSVGDVRLRRYGAVSYSPNSACDFCCVLNMA